MDAISPRPKRQDGVVTSLNIAIEAMNLAKEASSVTPAKAVFGVVGVLLTMIKDSVANKTEFVELGLACFEVCKALNRGTAGEKSDTLSQTVRDAIEQLRTTVTEIQEKVTEKAERNALSRLVHAKNDKEMIAAWRSDLNRILHIFDTELLLNINYVVSKLASQKEAKRKNQLAQPRIPPGETPPPPPRTCLGRYKLIQKIISLAENLTPIALIGAGGIGKTSIALTVLHHDHIKQLFGDNRRFIHCDQFPASYTNFLRQLSKVIGAGVKNPEDLTPLRHFISSRKMILILDNVESILDSRGKNAQKIYGAIEELAQFKNLCLCITSRLSTVPPTCKTLNIPTLSMEAAHDTFYRIYNGRRSNLVNKILEQLDFHPLSITLLATVALHNKWGAKQLATAWEKQRTGVLHTHDNKSLAATIELSLTSPTFQELSPHARGLLGVIAFLPQGVNKDNLDWLLPTIPNRRTIIDKFCVLSLTYQNNGFITMLAPLRDYLCPKDPMSSPLLLKTKKCYFTRLSVTVTPNKPGFEEAQWIISEDVNVEHLLDVFTTIDAKSTDVWDACTSFMRHLFWHKSRLVGLGPKIEGLPDNHPSKPQCLFGLSRLFESVGNHTERKRLLLYTLKLWRQRGDKKQVAQMLGFLSDANQGLGLYKEGIKQAKEALEIERQLKNEWRQAQSWQQLAWLLYGDNQLDAAEEAISHGINILSAKGDHFEVCQSHRLLGGIYSSKGKIEEAINQHKTALKIASQFSWHNEQSQIYRSLAELFYKQEKFDDAHVHIKHAKLHAANDKRLLGCLMELQASIWCKQHKLKEAKSEVLRAIDVLKKLGATKDLEKCRDTLQDIEKKSMKQITFAQKTKDHPKPKPKQKPHP